MGQREVEWEEWRTDIGDRVRSRDGVEETERGWQGALGNREGVDKEGARASRM